MIYSKLTSQHEFCPRIEDTDTGINIRTEKQTETHRERHTHTHTDTQSVKDNGRLTVL